MGNAKPKWVSRIAHCSICTRPSSLGLQTIVATESPTSTKIGATDIGTTSFWLLSDGTWIEARRSAGRWCRSAWPGHNLEEYCHMHIGKHLADSEYAVWKQYVFQSDFCWTKQMPYPWVRLHRFGSIDFITPLGKITCKFCLRLDSSGQFQAPNALCHVSRTSDRQDSQYLAATRRSLSYVAYTCLLPEYQMWQSWASKVQFT